GRWLWFLSDRHFESVVQSIWGSRQPDPFFDKRTKLYGVSLTPGFRSPFEPADELHTGDETGEVTSADSSRSKRSHKPEAKSAKGAASVSKPVEIVLAGLAERLIETPAPPGNYSELTTDGKRLYYLDASTAAEPKQALRSLAIDRDGDEPSTLMEDV